MKYFILFGLCLAFGWNGFAQSALPFPLQNATWETDFMTSSIGPPPGGTGHVYKQYRTSGSKMIGGINYTIIESGNKSEYAYLREDSQVVYCRYAPGIGYSSDEFVLYDFNLQLGDTFLLPMSGSSIQYVPGVVNFVDSILIGDVPHRRIWIDGTWWSSFTFMEGIGAVEGLLYPEIWPTDQSAALTCFSRNDTIFSIYGANTTQDGNCWRFVGLETLFRQNVVVYPNPCMDWIQIQCEQFKKARLYELQGEMIMEFTDVKHFVQDLSSGSYLLVVENQHGRKTHHKLVKAD